MNAQQLQLPLFNTVKVRNLSGVRYVFGQYRFDPMQVLEVGVDDAQELLTKVRRGGGCCGSGNPVARHLFEIVED